MDLTIEEQERLFKLLDSSSDNEFLAYSILSKTHCPKEQITIDWKGFKFSFSDFVKFKSGCALNRNKEIRDRPNEYQLEPFSSNLDTIRTLADY